MCKHSVICVFATSIVLLRINDRTYRARFGFSSSLSVAQSLPQIGADIFWDPHTSTQSTKHKHSRLRYIENACQINANSYIYTKSFKAALWLAKVLWFHELWRCDSARLSGWRDRAQTHT